MRFLIFTRIPERQGMLGLVKERWTFDETEAETAEEVHQSVHVPLHGECFVVAAEDATHIRSRIITEVINEDGR